MTIIVIEPDDKLQTYNTVYLPPDEPGYVAKYYVGMWIKTTFDDCLTKQGKHKPYYKRFYKVAR